MFQRQLQFAMLELQLHGATVVDVLAAFALVYLGYRLMRRRVPGRRQ
jgi:hypothetical protein